MGQFCVKLGFSAFAQMGAVEPLGAGRQDGWWGPSWGTSPTGIISPAWMGTEVGEGHSATSSCLSFLP